MTETYENTAELLTRYGKGRGRQKAGSIPKCFKMNG